VEPASAYAAWMADSVYGVVSEIISGWEAAVSSFGRIPDHEPLSERRHANRALLGDRSRLLSMCYCLPVKTRPRRQRTSLDSLPMLFWA
jgi:hypothetical protein